MAGMLQDSRNDTLLRQLHQAVDIHLSDSVNVPGKLAVPGEQFRIPPMRAKDSLNREFIPMLQKQSSLKRLIKREDTLMATIPPIQAEQVIWLTEVPPNAQVVLPERKIERDTPDWEIAVFILALILVGSVRLFFNKYLGQLLNATVSYITASRMFRERSLGTVYASVRLDVMFNIIAAVFVFHALQVFDIRLHPIDIIGYLIILAGIFAYFGIKKGIYYIQGYISRTLPETLEFLYNINIFNRVTGLFLLPLSLITAFTPLVEPRWIIFPGFAVVGLFYLLLLFRGINILIRKHFSIFYLILYLCTLEILPLLFIYKLVLG